MKVVEARFVMDKEGNPAVISKCQIGVFEKSGKFQMGFGIAKDRQTGELYLFAFRERPDNPIAVLRSRQKAVEWLGKALEKNGYKWYHLYVSEIEKVNRLYAFMVPFDAEGWNELPLSVRKDFEKMLELLKSA